MQLSKICNPSPSSSLVGMMVNSTVACCRHANQFADQLANQAIDDGGFDGMEDMEVCYWLLI